MTSNEDPFDSLLSLEDDFYKDGYDLGVSDGQKAGLVEGRFFGFEKGFEKYAAMGRLHGKATVWAGRLPKSGSTTVDSVTQGPKGADPDQSNDNGKDTHDHGGETSHVTPLSGNPRLEAHIRTLYALTEPSSLSTENTEEAVSEFDDRLKRAEGKVKVIEKLIGEPSLTTDDMLGKTQSAASNDAKSKAKGDDSIEDISNLSVRR